VADWIGENSVLYEGDGERRFTISPTNDRRSVPLSEAQGTEAELAAAILQSELVLHLRKDQTLSRGYNTADFYELTPDAVHQPSFQGNLRHSGPQGQENQEVDIFRGFTFRIMHLDGVGLCAVLDVRTRYIGRHNLAGYLKGGRNLADMQERWAIERWVNDYGSAKQSVFILRVERHGIGTVVLKDGQSTYDYLQRRYPLVRSQITPADLAVTMVYQRDDQHDESKHYTGASSLLKPLFTTGSPQVRSLRDVAAFAPRERLNRIEVLRGRLDGARFAGRTITFGAAVLSSPSILALPSLVFGSEKILQPSSVGHTEREVRQRWGASKTTYLKNHGPYRQAPFTNPYFVYPESLERDGLLETFLEETASACQEYGRTDFTPILSPYLDDARPKDIIAKVRGITDANRAGFVLLGLPQNPKTADLVYVGVKSGIPVPSKCFSSKKLQGWARDAQRRANYIRGNSLAMLVENGTRPWGLSSRLNHEMQFGFDSTRYGNGGLMGAAVISDTSGIDITFAYEGIRARERIDTKVIGKFVQQQLERFHAINGRSPESLLFQRDGRLLETERKGIERALSLFAEAHPTEPRPTWTMVTVEKSTSVPLRIFRKVMGQIDAPFGGTYIIQQKHIAFLVLAGFPSRQGTPRPVRIEVVAGSDDGPDIVPILQDIFRLSQLNWNTPEIAINLPLTLRFTDQKLERYALEGDSDPDYPDDDWDDDDDK